MPLPPTSPHPSVFTTGTAVNDEPGFPTTAGTAVIHEPELRITAGTAVFHEPELRTAAGTAVIHEPDLVLQQEQLSSTSRSSHYSRNS